MSCDHVQFGGRGVDSHSISAPGPVRLFSGSPDCGSPACASLAKLRGNKDAAAMMPPTSAVSVPAALAFPLVRTGQRKFRKSDRYTGVVAADRASADREAAYRSAAMVRSSIMHRCRHDPRYLGCPFPDYPQLEAGRSSAGPGDGAGACSRRHPSRTQMQRRCDLRSFMIVLESGFGLNASGQQFQVASPALCGSRRTGFCAEPRFPDCDHLLGALWRGAARFAGCSGLADHRDAGFHRARCLTRLISP